MQLFFQLFFRFIKVGWHHQLFVIVFCNHSTKVQKRCSPPRNGGDVKRRGYKDYWSKTQK